jgi:hypothetical protein
MAPQEWDNQFGNNGQVEYVEHSHKSGAKKVINGPLTLAIDPASALKTIDPIQAATGTSIQLLRNKAYRVISDVAFRFRMTIGSGTAVATDTYVPANTPIVISTRDFDYISTVAVAAAGFINCVEVL